MISLRLGERPVEQELLARAVGGGDRVELVAVEQRERVVLEDVDVEVLEELDLGRALRDVDEQLERVGLLLRALEVERAGHGLEPRHRDVEVGVRDLADVEVGELDLHLRAAQVRIGQLDEDVGGLDVAVTGVAHEVRELDGGRDRDDVLEHAEDALAQRDREQIVAAALLARALEALLEAHVEQLEDHEVVLDLVADRRRDEPGAVAFARGEQLDDVRVTLDALEDLLLHLEAHLVLAGDAALQTLDRDRAAQRRLRLDPALLAEIRLREATASRARSAWPVSSTTNA